MSRKRIPQEIKELRGATESDFIKDVVVPCYGAPALPSRLSAEEAQVFLETCKLLADMHTLARSDANVIERYAVAIVEERVLRLDVAQNGFYYTVTLRDGTVYEKPRQAVDIRLRRETSLLNYESKLGLNPVDRSKISQIVNKEGADSILAFLDEQPTD